MTITALLSPPGIGPQGEEVLGTDGSLPFWRATGFSRSDFKGLEEGQVGLKIDVRKFGKQQRRQLEQKGTGAGGQSLISWSELLSEVGRGAGSAIQGVRLPAPCHKAPETP